MNGDSGGTSDKIQSIVSWTCRNDFSGLSGDTHLLWILQVVNDRTRKEQLKIFAYGEVAEWPIVQHWKCCVRVTGPGVRIPPSPLNGMPLSHTLVTQRQVSDQGTTEKKNSLVAKTISVRVASTWVRAAALATTPARYG